MARQYGTPVVAATALPQAQITRRDGFFSQGRKRYDTLGDLRDNILHVFLHI